MENASELSVGIIAGTALLVAMASLIIILAITYQNKRKEFLRKAQQEQFYAALDAERKERERIARDLHDGVSGYLNATLNFLALAKNKSGNEMEEMMSNIRLGILEAVNSIKEVSYNLAPSVLTQEGFVLAFKQLSFNLFGKSDIQMEFNSCSTFPSLDETVSYELYRSLQEYLTNIIKYGNANKVTINVENNDYFRINILDNGNKFSFEEAAKKKGNHNGIKNIITRLQRIKASFKHFRNEDDLNEFIIVLKPTL